MISAASVQGRARGVPRCQKRPAEDSISGLLSRPDGLVISLRNPAPGPIARRASPIRLQKQFIRRAGTYRTIHTDLEIVRLGTEVRAVLPTLKMKF